MCCIPRSINNTTAKLCDHSSVVTCSKHTRELTMHAASLMQLHTAKTALPSSASRHNVLARRCCLRSATCIVGWVTPDAGTARCRALHRVHTGQCTSLCIVHGHTEQCRLAGMEGRWSRHDMVGHTHGHTAGLCCISGCTAHACCLQRECRELMTISFGTKNAC